MFRAIEVDSPGFGPAAAMAAAAPVLDLTELAAPTLLERIAAHDWTPDLAEDIGSRRWLRGMATMLGLMGLALAFWPGFARLDAAPSVRLDAAAADEFHAQAILPQAFGGSAGRRMGPGYTLRAVPFVPERAEIQLSAVLSPGDSLARLFQRAGAAVPDAARAAQLVAAAVPEDQLAPGTKVALVLGPRPSPGQPRPLLHADLRARFDLALAVNRAGGGFALEKRAIAVDSTPVRIRGVVGESLYRSARAAGAAPQTIQQYLQALDAHLSLEGDVQPGDTFDLVFAMKRAATGETEVGGLTYAALNRGAAPVAELLRWGSGEGFYSADSFTAQDIVQTGPAGGMMMPVNGRVTSLYGQRFHPILGYARMHSGVDFGASWGSPIIATGAGVVSFAGYHGGHGNYVRLEHGGGLGTGYGHMSRIAVAPGTRVRAGEIIGYVGSTGLSTGPHLHYEMYQNGRTINPLSGGFAHVTRTVDTRDLAAFRAKLAEMKALRVGTRFAARPAVQHIAMR